MATPAVFLEEECLNVYWKIKNFSYCGEYVLSPTFNLSGKPNRIMLKLGFVNVECSIYYVHSSKTEISFITSDGSMEEPISCDITGVLKVRRDIIFGSRRTSFLPEDTLSVRCRIRTEFGREKIFIYSQIGVQRKYFLWTFKHESNYSYNYEKFVENSDFYGSIRLKLKSIGGIHSDEQFDVEICRRKGESCCCVLKISVLDVDGKVATEVSDEFIFEKKDDAQVRSFPSIIKKSKWLKYKHLLLSEDKLTLKCYLAITTGKVSHETADVCICEIATPLLKESGDLSRAFQENKDSRSVTELQTDLKCLLETATFHDVSLRIGSEVIPAHKSILCARSPVFKVMLTGGMKEAIDNTVVIEEFDVETVQRLLRYIYTDSIVGEEWENMKQLYMVSNKYQVLSLKEKCVSFLESNLSVSNVSEALLLADFHQDANLKTAVIYFISEYNLAVFASEAWKNLEKKYYPLALQALREIISNKRLG